MPDCQMDEIVLFLASDLIFENVFPTLEKVLVGKKHFATSEGDGEDEICCSFCDILGIFSITIVIKPC